jgi:hypothetical protein
MGEIRPDVTTTNEANLAFYYHHKNAMQAILTLEKANELASVGLDIEAQNITVTASCVVHLKRVRGYRGSSRSDEIHLGGLNGIGELFLK